MGAKDDGKAVQAQVAGDPQAQGDEAAARQAQVTGGANGDDAARARADYEAALKERDEKIAALEGEIAEAAKTADAVERLRAEMDELHRRGEEQHVGFGLQMAGARNVKAARPLLADYDNDIDKLKAGEP